MKKFILLSILLSATVTGFSHKGLKPLFNGKDLRGWDTYVGTQDKGGKPVGLNSDPLKIFTVIEKDGAGLLRVSGETNASIATQKSYEDYHVQMVFKWGDKIYRQLNSGLLYHSYGPFGAGLDVWMSSHEFQLCTGKMGDSYCMGTSYFEIPSVSSSEGKTLTYSSTGDKVPFGDGRIAKNCSKGGDYEKPVGEWNTIDLYCFGRTSVHVVNGKVTMVNFNSGKIENGKVLPLTGGKIQIQSEGGELFIRSLEIEKIKEIPAALIK